ncbi:MAG: hypothetical protein ACRENP_20980 [Longimicrobiales bacterium]
MRICPLDIPAIAIRDRMNRDEPAVATVPVYSRMPTDTFALNFQEMMSDLPNRYPNLPARINVFSLVEHGTPHWKDPATAAALKLRVKELLGDRPHCGESQDASCG